MHFSSLKFLLHIVSFILFFYNKTNAQIITQQTNTKDNVHIFKHAALLIPILHVAGSDTNYWNRDFRLLEGAERLYGRDLGKYYFPKLLRLITAMDTFISEHLEDFKVRPDLLPELANKICTVDENLVFISPDIGDRNYFSMNESLTFFSFDKKDRENWVQEIANHGVNDSSVLTFLELADRKRMALSKLLLWWVDNFEHKATALPEISMIGDFAHCICENSKDSMTFRYQFSGNEIEDVKYHGKRQFFSATELKIAGFIQPAGSEVLLEYFTLYYHDKNNENKLDSMVVVFTETLAPKAATFASTFPSYLSGNAVYNIQFGLNKSTCMIGQVQCSNGIMKYMGDQEFQYTAPMVKTPTPVHFGYALKTGDGSWVNVGKHTITLMPYDSKAAALFTANTIQFVFDIPSNLMDATCK